MKIILVTGKLTEKRVRKIAEKHAHQVFTAPVQVASLLKADEIPQFKDYDLVMFPGYVNLDLLALEKKVGAQCVKGPKDIANLEFVLQNLDKINLSRSIPACELLIDKLKEKAVTDIKRVESDKIKTKLLKKKSNFLIGDLAVGIDFPIRVIAEIVDADRLDDGELLTRAQYYIHQGADVIDIGMSESNPQRVKEMISQLQTLGTPLSIDTMDKENIRAAIGSGIDLILSLDKELIQSIDPKGIPVVIVHDKSKLTHSKSKVSAMKEAISVAKQKGYTNIIIDPILEPINYGITDSIRTFLDLSRDQDLPMMMGVGNVTELTDADSIGINALLAGIAMEIGVGLLFTTEASDKTQGCIKELKGASMMMFLAKQRGSTPKDLGIDLLKLKEKRKRPSEKRSSGRTIKAKRSGSSNKDEAGDFRINIEGDQIIATHIQKGYPDIAISGKASQEIFDTILRKGLVSTIDHGFYLGRELKKADIALRTNRSYVQDEELFGLER